MSRFKLMQVVYITIALPFVSAFLIGCSKDDEPDWNPPNEPGWNKPSDDSNNGNDSDEDNSLPNGVDAKIDNLYFKIESSYCAVVGQVKEYFPKILNIPESVEINGDTYSVQKISKDANVSAYTVVIPKSVLDIKENAVSYETKQIIVGENVTKIDKHAWHNVKDRTTTSATYGPKKKVLWLSNTAPRIIYDPSIECCSIEDQTNYASTYLTGLYTIVLPSISSFFWEDGFLCAPVDISKKTCMLLGYDYEERTSIEIKETLTHNGIDFSVSSCGDYLLSDANKLTDIKYNGSITKGMFWGCSSLPAFEIGDKATNIGSQAFRDCTSLTKISFLDSDNKLNVYDAPSTIFKNAPLEEIYIGRNLDITTNFEKSLFSGINTIKSVVISDTPTSIGGFLFQDCTGLKSVHIGDRVQTIEKKAFSGDYALETFTIGSGVSTIMQGAFSDCYGLKTFKTEAIKPPFCYSQALDDIDKWKCKLIVPKESLENYKSASQWNNFIYIEAE